ncbi:MAG: hypothetical protein R6W99_09930, partial [Clostridia bacterium]
CAFGFDGWVEVWDMDFDLLSASDRLVLSKTYESHGTRVSTMSPENYRKAVDMLFASSNLKSWAIRDVTPQEIGYEDQELGHDYKSEYDFYYPADHFHRTEYRIFYDHITDYQLVSLKNTEEMLFPSVESYYSYLLLPLSHRTGLEHTYSFQFLQAGLASQIMRIGADGYRDLAFQYSFYKNDDFDDDENLPFCQGMVLVDNDGSDLFSFSITLQADLADYSSSYLKITPMWITHAGLYRDSFTPVMLDWDLTGLTRTITYHRDEQGNSEICVQHLASAADFALMPPGNTEISQVETAANARKHSEDSSYLIYDPDSPASERFTCVESATDLFSYVSTAAGSTKSVITTVVKIIVAQKDKVKEISDLPSDHWARSFKYNGVIAGLEAVTGVIAIYTNGKEAILAFQNGETIECVYYGLKTITSAGETVSAMASVSKNVVAVSKRVGGFTKLASDGVGIGLAVAVGVIETSYNVYKWQTTQDPIQKSAYGEKMFASSFDTVLNVATVLYGPLAAFQATWKIGIEIYGLIAGHDIAYQVAQSPSSAVVFIAAYWSEAVPSQIAEAAYDDAVEELMEKFERMNHWQQLYIPVFIDPKH